MKSKCELVLEKYFELDKNKRVPFKLFLHLIMCKDCRKKIFMLSKAQKIVQKPLNVVAPVTDSVIENVLENYEVQNKLKINKNPISLVQWIFSGSAMIIMILFTIFLVDRLNSKELLMSYALMIAIAVTIYCVSFIWCNLDFFVKKLDVKLIK